MPFLSSPERENAGNLGSRRFHGDRSAVEIIVVHQDHIKLQGLSIPPDGKGQRVAYAVLVLDVVDLLGGGDGDVVDLQKHVALADALGISVGALQHRGDIQAGI